VLEGLQRGSGGIGWGWQVALVGAGRCGGNSHFRSMLRFQVISMLLYHQLCRSCQTHSSSWTQHVRGLACWRVVVL
jgi:hypothetical protein